MNISYRWLRALAPTIQESPAELVERLSSLGAPVDELVPLGDAVGDVVIARVEGVRPHPNADRLRLCTVNAGGADTVQVVCGAPNVKSGQFYPFAPVGAELPGGIKIRKAKLRGESSEGMLCSARELGLGRDHAGLMALHGTWAPGAPLVQSLGLDDVRLVVDVTPNRSELLSHIGVARELAPEGHADLQLPAFPDAWGGELHVRPPSDGETVGGVCISIADPDGCPRYTAAVVRGVSVGPSPEWLATRLRAVGVRPINNVVDATNYVLYELGQPLHAFDLSRLAGSEIRVRRARPGERITTIDGVERTLAGDELVIADAREPVALAGVMGGENSEVTADTKDVLIECALFDPKTVRRTARRLGLVTDAAHRFERGVDPAGQPVALARVVDLITAVAGGTPEPLALDINPVPFRRTRLALRPSRVEQVLGVAVPAAEVKRLLAPIGFQVEAEGGALQVVVPGFRPDVTAEIDLIEEIARRRGYDSFPEEPRPFRPSAVPDDPRIAVHVRVREIFVKWGFLEVRTAGFAPAAEGRVPLLSPLSAEEGSLRDALVPGLLRRLEHNLARGTRNVRLFELGTVFFPGAAGGAAAEEVHVAAVFTGTRRPPHWSGPVADWDVWDLKALLREVAEAIGAGAVEPGRPEDGFASVGGVDWLRLHSAGARAPGGGAQAASADMDAPAWAAPAWVLEVRLPPQLRPRARTYQGIPEHPAVERDLALLVPTATPAAEVERLIGEHAGEMLESVQPFDRYTGKGIAEGTTSLGWRLRFRAPDRTLTDQEVEAAVQGVLRTLDERLSVRLR